MPLERRSDFQRELRLTTISVVAAVLAVVASGVAIAAGAVHEVSQRGRMFAPLTIAIAKGDTLRIVNNDADLLHHAYVESPTFNFDSGEQQPGTSVDIQFTKAGEFEVLCGIHPKMRLAVSVK